MATKLDRCIKVIGILLAFPYGIAADRVGRKPIFLLYVLGVWLGDAWVKLVCELSNLSTIRLVHRE